MSGTRKTVPKAATATELCQTCGAWLREDSKNGGNAAFGQCRRLPPFPNGLGGALWPGTHASDWCAEWYEKR